MLRLRDEVGVSRAQNFFDRVEQGVHRAVEAIETIEDVVGAAPEIVLIVR